MNVLLVGGLGATPWMMAPLRKALTRLEVDCRLAPTGLGVDCSEAIADRVERTLEEMRAATGRPAAVVGHSRGGQVARVVAARRPDLVRGLVALGAPLVNPKGANPMVLAGMGVLSAAGTAGLPGLLRMSCLWGDCHDRMRSILLGPFPAHVPFVSIYSRRDRIVPWRSSLDPAAEHREVSTSHGGLLLATEEISRALCVLDGQTEGVSIPA